MGGKNLPSPKVRSGKVSKRSTPAKSTSNQTPKSKSKSKSDSRTEQTPPKAVTPRVRKRASDFATKKRSAKKRPRETVEDTDDIDNTLQGLRDALNSDAGDEKGAISERLLSALKRARDAFENDESDSSSSEEGGEDAEQSNEKGRENAKAKLRTPLKETKKTLRKELQPSPRTPRVGVATANGDASDLVTPKRSERKSSKKVNSTATKKGSGEEGGKRSGLKKTTASAHKRDIEDLKKDDPEFYKFLEENDVALLEFDDEDGLDDVDEDGEDEEDSAGKGDEIDTAADGDDEEDRIEVGEEDIDQKNDDESEGAEASSESDESDVENASKDGSKAAVDDVHGYSDEDEDDDDEEGAEAEAAAEAGLDLNGLQPEDSELEDDDDDESEDENEDDVQEAISGKKENTSTKQKKMIFVDMAYLRDIKEQLKSNRTSLKSAKELLRLFRAGKDILPGQAGSQNKKAKNKKRSRKDEHLERGADMEDDEFADDGSFTSGKVRFASAKAYQLAMNLAITGVQDALDRMLGKPESKKGSSERQMSKWDPTDSGRWFNLQPVFRSYVFHMLSLCDAMVDPATSRFLLKRLEKLVPYTRDNKVLLKKIIKIAVHVWSADALHMSEASRLRAYLLLNKLAHGPGNAETVLRSSCAVYGSSIANVCNPRTLPRIHFATTCIVELFGIDMGASYTTAFANLREMAISLRAVLVSKQEKDEVERIHNWSYINRLRLWSQVLAKYGGAEELQPLIYPYVQVSLGVMRVHATPRTFPMRLHVASYLSELVAQTGTYIPLAPHLLSLLRCSELRKKPGHGNSKALEWRSILRVSSDTIKTKPFLTGVLDGVILQLAKYFAIISRHVSFPEVAHVAEVTLRKFAKEVMVSEWKSKVMALVEKLRQTSEMITEARTKADFSPQGAVSSDGMLGCVPGIDREKKTPIQRFFEVEFARVQKQENLRDEKVTTKQAKATSKGKDSEDQSEAEDSDSEPEPAPKRAKKAKSSHAKHPTKKGRPSLSILDLAGDDDEADIVQDLILDSDGSDKE